MLDINTVGQELSYLIRGLSNEDDIVKQRVLEEVEAKISHIAWGSFNTEDSRLKFIGGLVSETSSYDLWVSLDAVKTCLSKEYIVISDPNMVDKPENCFEILEDIVQQAVLQKMGMELTYAKKRAEEDLLLSKSMENPALNEIAVNHSKVNAAFNIGNVELDMERFKQQVIAPSKIEKQIEMLKVQRKRGTIGTSDYAIKMAELRDLEEYYTLNGEITAIKCFDSRSDLMLAVDEAKSKYENGQPVNRQYWEKCKADNSLKIIDLQEQSFETKKRIDIRENNKALAEGKVTEEQWRQNKVGIDARMSPLQIEEAKKRVTRMNASSNVENNSGPSMSPM
jgi:hypothetical protein